MATGDHDWTAGETVTAANVDDYLQLQTVQQFATAAARDTALSARKREGMLTYQLDTNTLTIYTGAAWSTIGPTHGAWTSFTSTWSGTVGDGTKVSYYRRVGRDIQFRIKITWGTTTSHPAAQQTWSLPFTEHADYTEHMVIGLATGRDTSAVLTHNAIVLIVAPGSYVSCQIGGSTTLWTNTLPVTWGTGDTFSMSGTYEANADA